MSRTRSPLPPSTRPARSTRRSPSPSERRFSFFFSCRPRRSGVFFPIFFPPPPTAVFFFFFFFFPVAPDRAALFSRKTVRLTRAVLFFLFQTEPSLSRERTRRWGHHTLVFREPPSPPLSLSLWIIVPRERDASLFIFLFSLRFHKRRRRAGTRRTPADLTPSTSPCSQKSSPSTSPSRNKHTETRLRARACLSLQHIPYAFLSLHYITRTSARASASPAAAAGVLMKPALSPHAPRPSCVEPDRGK